MRLNAIDLTLLTSLTKPLRHWNRTKTKERRKASIDRPFNVHTTGEATDNI